MHRSSRCTSQRRTQQAPSRQSRTSSLLGSRCTRLHLQGSSSSSSCLARTAAPRSRRSDSTTRRRTRRTTAHPHCPAACRPRTACTWGSPCSLHTSPQGTGLGPHRHQHRTSQQGSRSSQVSRRHPSCLGRSPGCTSPPARCSRPEGRSYQSRIRCTPSCLSCPDTSQQGTVRKLGSKTTRQTCQQRTACGSSRPRRRSCRQGTPCTRFQL